MATVHTSTNQLPVPITRTPDRLLKYFKRTGIMLTVAGSVMIALGVTAIGITARFAYAAVPVWGGMIIIASGILGLNLYSKQFNRLVMTSFISLSGVSACISVSLVVIGILAADLEFDYYCYPLGYNECRGPYWSRVFIDSLIALNAMFALVVSIVAASIGGYKACACCRACCYGDYHHGDAPMVVFTSSGSVLPLTFQSNTTQGNVLTLAVPQNAISGEVGSTPLAGQTVLIPLDNKTSQQGQGQLFVLAQTQTQTQTQIQD